MVVARGERGDQLSCLNDSRVVKGHSIGNNSVRSGSTGGPPCNRCTQPSDALITRREAEEERHNIGAGDEVLRENTLPNLCSCRHADKQLVATKEDTAPIADPGSATSSRSNARRRRAHGGGDSGISSISISSPSSPSIVALRGRDICRGELSL